MAGIAHATAFCPNLGIDFAQRTSSVHFLFKRGFKTGIGMVTLRTPMTEGVVLLFPSDMVDANIPVVMGLHVMRHCRLTLDFHRHELQSADPPLVFAYPPQIRT